MDVIGRSYMLITFRSSKANISVLQLEPIQKHSQEHVHIVLRC